MSHTCTRVYDLREKLASKIYLYLASYLYRIYNIYLSTVPARIRTYCRGYAVRVVKHTFVADKRVRSSL